LHVVVCRTEDAPGYFLERLQHLSFNTTLAEIDKATLRALKEGLAAPNRTVCTDGWPPVGPTDHDGRRQDLKELLSTLDETGRHLLLLTRTIDQGWSAATEMVLLREFAEMLASKFRANPDGVQAVVIFTVAAGPGAEALAFDFSRMWHPAAPSNCGVCVQLRSVGVDELTSWKQALKNAWGENELFLREVDSQFKGSALKPLNEIVVGLSDSLKEYIMSALGAASPPRRT
jgi:hypothetical protein